VSVTDLREYQTRRLEQAAERMAETLAAMRVPDELQAAWDSRLDTAVKARILKAETDRPGDGLPALWRELVAVESGWRRTGA
jgi:hypothetical protein